MSPPPSRHPSSRTPLRPSALATVGLAMIVGLSACAGSPNPPSTAQLSKASGVTFAQIGIDEVRDGADATVRAARGLGWDLIRAGADGTGNMVVSPWSAQTALAMVRAGAGGRTAAELDTVLGGYDPHALAALAGQLSSAEGDPGRVDPDNPPDDPVYHQGNGVFVDKSLRVRPDYLTALGRYFNSGYYPVEFASKRSAATIAEWLSVNTGDQITTPPVPYNPDTVMSLLSTVYLAAAWQTPFSPGSTMQSAFTRTDGEVVQAEMMHATPRVRVVEGDTWRAVELPYGAGSTDSGLAMQVILPDRPGIAPAQAVTADVLGDVASRLRAATPSPVQLSLPRWQTDTKMNLIPTLQKLGVRQLFTDRADLEAIGPRLTVSAAAQSGTITVGEKGTVAAAATQIDLMPTSVPLGEPFVVDRPFAYQIIDVATGLPLFVGTVDDPTTR
ncbi:serpin family protein [Williamsia sterculiae]|uniref:Serpin B n=1 Tax=Williamsia sterculiae TaxID=1344003 RepID=A0A1N7DVH5_9NOCA|nr:serpin family protein [Williamsia sterculiae]SIR79852.1 serpin B [Williamsia sterculiae]